MSCLLFCSPAIRFFAQLMPALLASSVAFAQAPKKTEPPKPAATGQATPQVQAMPPEPAKANPALAAEKLKAGLKALDDKQFEVALKAFNEAFGAGNPDGAFYLGRMVELGVGVQQDFDKARILYLAASDKGSAKAMNRLGLMHYRGEKVLQDYKVAQELMCKAAEMGDADSAFNCAGLYAEGKGVPKDMEKALGWYKKAADQGHIGALNAMGFAYRDGLGTKADLAVAQSWFEKAASKGNPIGLFELGTMYEVGQPMARDLSRAHLYYNLAAARQHPNASLAIQRVSGQMSAEEIAKAQDAARAWKASE